MSTADFRYRAFISYSHKDTAAARWLHKSLEGFRLDKTLFGEPSPIGPIPKRLAPIFRDREEFAAGHSLTGQTLAALDASAALVVICSPEAAASAYVNEEIRLFRHRHPQRPVIPMIVAGTPGSEEDEPFPPALRCRIDADGAVTDEPEDVLAADWREEADGRALALAKIVARLIGRTTDDIYRRAERARRRTARIRNGVIAALALLAIAATGSAFYAWQQLKTNEAFLDATLKRFTELVNYAVETGQSYSVPLSVTLGFLDRANAQWREDVETSRRVFARVRAAIRLAE